MMQKPAIGSDLDDTIIDHRGNRRKLAEKYGFDLTDTELYLLKEQNVPGETVAAFKRELYGPLSQTAPPVAGAVEALEALNEQYELAIISRRREPEYARSWIEMNLPFMDLDRAHFTKTHEEKVPIARSLSVTIFIDDLPKVLDVFDEDIRRILFDPFDLHADTPHERVRGWNEIGERFLEQ